MPYKNKTSHYGIPYISKDEQIDYFEEKRKTQMIDNLLFSGNMGLSKALFDDGYYSIVKGEGDSYILKIQNNASYSLLGIVNYRLFCSDKTVEFTDMYRGTFYYIYVSYSSSLDVDEKSFIPLATTNKYAKDDNTKVLLATVDLTLENPIIDENPEGKMYAEELLVHLSNYTNPHGRKLIQDEIDTDKLNIKGKPVYKTIYFEDKFPGPNAVLKKEFDSEVVFVNIMPTSLGYGEYKINIEGKIIFIHNTNQTTSFKAEVKLL